MIALDGINKSLQIVLAGAKATNDMDWSASFANGTGIAENDGQSNGTTVVNIVPAPILQTSAGISSGRYLTTFSIYNADTTAQTVLVELKNDSSIRKICSIDLAVGYTLHYEAGRGWYTMDTNGAIVNIEVSLSGISIGEAVVGYTSNEVLYVDNAGLLQQLHVATYPSLTELSYVKGVTSGIQAQINAITAGGITGTLTTGIMPKASGAHTVSDSYLTEVAAGTKWAASKGICNAAGTLIFDPNTSIFYNASSSKKADMINGQLFNVGAVLSIDWIVRGFYNSSGIRVVDYSGSSVKFNYATVSTVPYFDASGNLISSAVTPTELVYVSGVTSSIQTQLGTKAPINNPTFTGTVTLAADATSGLQAVTYQQLQVAINGLDKEAVKFATTGPLPAVVYNNGAGTLTGVAFGAISTDGGSPTVGEYILVKDQVSTFQNGWYVVTTTGSGIAVFVLTRRFDSNVSAEFRTGDTTFVTSGTTLSTTTWAYNGIDNPVLGTDAITFVQTAGQGSFIAGAGITITGTTISISANAVVNSMINSVAWSKITSTPTTLSGYGITDAVSSTLASGKIIIGSAGNLATAVSMAKDALIDNVGNVTVSSINSVSIALAGSFQTFGAYALQITTTAATAITLPTSGTLYGTKAASITSAQMLASMSDPTGTGLSVFATSPTLVTPVLGVAGATSLAVTGTGGNGFVTFLTQSSQPTYGASGFVLYANSTGKLAWRVQADTYERSFNFGTLTADKVITFKTNTSYTVADNADLVSLAGIYRTIRTATIDLVATMPAATAWMGFASMSVTTTNSGTAVANFPGHIYINSADYPSINGLTPKLRIQVWLSVNHVAPTGNFTFGLYPITQPASSGGALLKSWTIGTVVSGSNGATFTTPAADSLTFATGADFALPADGLYGICVVFTATIATSSVVMCLADLQLRYT